MASSSRTPRPEIQASQAASEANIPVSGSARASPTKPVRPVALRNAALRPPETPQSSPNPTQPAASPVAPCAVMLIHTSPGVLRTIRSASIPSCSSARGLAASMTMSDAAMSESNACRSPPSARSTATVCLPLIDERIKITFRVPHGVRARAALDFHDLGAREPEKVRGKRSRPQRREIDDARCGAHGRRRVGRRRCAGRRSARAGCQLRPHGESLRPNRGACSKARAVARAPPQWPSPSSGRASPGRAHRFGPCKRRSPHRRSHPTRSSSKSAGSISDRSAGRARFSAIVSPSASNRRQPPPADVRPGIEKPARIARSPSSVAPSSARSAADPLATASRVNA
jgi:hypothetical protein